MKALLLCILAAVPLFGRAADDPRIYIHLLREHDELLCGTAQRHAQESATIVYPRDGDSVIVVIKPLRRAENALVGIRFYRELSEVQSPAAIRSIFLYRFCSHGSVTETFRATNCWALF